MIANILRKSSLPSLLAAAVGLAALSLSGCSLQTTATPTATVLPAVHGTVMGGETPIAGSNLILWETDPSNGGYGVAATQLATATGSTPGGSFSFTTGYTCAPGSFVYLTSTGGDVSDGAPTPIINDNAVLVAALGSCSNFATAAEQGSVSVIVNELSTVAAAYTLDNFMSVTASATGNQLVHISASGNNGGGSGFCIGAGSTMACTAAGLDHAFANAANLVSDSSLGGGTSGQAYTTVPGNSLGSVPQAEIDTLADIVQYCVNSPGGVSGDLSPCGNFFADATTPDGAVPADTLSALINIARFPRNNVGGLYGLVPATPAFAPTLAAEPHDWSLAIAYSGTNLGSFGVPQYLTLDANDNVYVMTSNLFAPTQMGLAAMTSSGTGLWNNPQSTQYCAAGTLATDTNGYVWESIEASSSVACSFNIDGFPTATGGSGTPTYVFAPGSSTVCNTASPTSANCPGFPAGGYDTVHEIQSTPNALAFDRLGNLWYGRKSSTCSECLFELPYTTGTPGTYGSPTNIQGVSSATPGTTDPPDINQIMIDTNDNIWMGNVTTSANVAFIFVLPNQSPTTPNAPTYTSPQGWLTATQPATDDGGIALDASGNIWTGSADTVSEYTPGTTAGVVTSFGTATNTTTAATKPYPGEVDGNGLFWYGSYTSSGDIYYQITPSSSLYSTTASVDTSDILPCYVPNGTTSCTVASGSPRVVQVDSTGALWVAAPGASGATTGYVLQVFGQANPTWPQLSYGVFATKPQ